MSMIQSREGSNEEEATSEIKNQSRSKEVTCGDNCSCPFCLDLSNDREPRDPFHSCRLLDYDDPTQQLVRVWARIHYDAREKARRNKVDCAFPPVPDGCPLRKKPIIVEPQREEWWRWGPSGLVDHYGDSPLGRLKKRIEAERAEKERRRQTRQAEKEAKEKAREERRLRQIEEAKAKELKRKV